MVNSYEWGQSTVYAESSPHAATQALLFIAAPIFNGRFYFEQVSGNDQKRCAPDM